MSTASTAARWTAAALRALAGLRPDTARLRDGQTIPIGQVVVGDVVLVEAGEIGAGFEFDLFKAARAEKFPGVSHIFFPEFSE